MSRSRRVGQSTALGRALGRYLDQPVRKCTGPQLVMLLGFWTVWHSYDGDRVRIVESGVMSRRTMYWHLRDFRAVFGVDPGDFMPQAAAALVAANEAEEAAREVA